MVGLMQVKTKNVENMNGTKKCIMKYVQFYLLKIAQIQKFDLTYYYLKTKFEIYFFIIIFRKNRDFHFSLFRT